MGNRAVLTTSKERNIRFSNELGVYLHWNGGRDSVEAFLLYCETKGYTSPENGSWARFCQVAGNFFGGTLDIDIDQLSRLDCDNYDNGVYIIEKWRIVGRLYMHNAEQHNHDLLQAMTDINSCQPVSEQLTADQIQAAVDRFRRRSA